MHRHLSTALRVALSGKTTSGGFRLDDVIRSGLANPDSAVGVYAQDAQSYSVFRELFGPILQDLQPAPRDIAEPLDRLHVASVISTRVRVARNLAGHTFPAGMSRLERLDVQEKIASACQSLTPDFEGRVWALQGLTHHQLEVMIANRQAFGPDDKYLAAAGVHNDWPIGRSVFCTPQGQVSAWINEEDHLRVAVVMPGACPDACHQTMRTVMARLATQLDFCTDAQLGYLTSCPSNVGTGLRVSYMVDLRYNAAQTAFLERLAGTGLLQIRGATGEHSPRSGGLAEVSFRHRVGMSETQTLQNMEALLARH